MDFLWLISVYQLNNNNKKQIFFKLHEDYSIKQFGSQFKLISKILFLNWDIITKVYIDKKKKNTCHLTVVYVDILVTTNK